MDRALASLSPIVTVRLSLAALTASDVAAVQALTDHAEIIRRITFLKSPFTLADAAALVARNAGPDECFFGIWRSSSPRDLSGVVGAHRRSSDEIEIGYWLGLGHQRQGYATEAVNGLVAGLRAAYPRTAIVAECDPQNAASWRVLEKAGFRPAGREGSRRGRQLLTLAR